MAKDGKATWESLSGNGEERDSTTAWSVSLENDFMGTRYLSTCGCDLKVIGRPRTICQTNSGMYAHDVLINKCKD